MPLVTNNIRLSWHKNKSAAKDSRIWNMEETGVTTIQNPNKNIVAYQQEQVGAERGSFVTLVFATNAAGNAIQLDVC